MFENDFEKLFSNINIMNKVELETLSKSDLINLILQQNKKTIKKKNTYTTL